MCRGVEKEHLLPTLRCGIPAPRHRQQAEQGIVEVRRLTRRIATVPHRTHRLTRCQPHPTVSNALQVGVVMQPPFRPQYQHHLAAAGQVTAIQHQTATAGDHRGTRRGKDIHALVDPGFPPGVIPEGLRMLIVAIRPLHGNMPPLWQQQPNDQQGQQPPQAAPDYRTESRHSSNHRSMPGLRYFCRCRTK